MQIPVKIGWVALVAAAHSSADKEGRPYLGGVYYEPAAGRATASDGHMAVQIAFERVPGVDDGGVIIGPKSIKALTALAKQAKIAGVELTEFKPCAPRGSGSGVVAFAACNGSGSLRFEGVTDQPFPDLPAALARLQTPAVAIEVNAVLLGTLCGVVKTLQPPRTPHMTLAIGGRGGQDSLHGRSVTPDGEVVDITLMGMCPDSPPPLPDGWRDAMDRAREVYEWLRDDGAETELVESAHMVAESLGAFRIKALSAPGEDSA